MHATFFVRLIERHANRITVVHALHGGHLVHLVHAEQVGGLISDWARDLR